MTTKDPVEGSLSTGTGWKADTPPAATPTTTPTPVEPWNDPDVDDKGRPSFATAQPQKQPEEVAPFMGHDLADK